MLFLLLGLGDYKSPGFNRSNLFLRRISNPPGRLAGLRLPFQAGTPSGVAFAIPSRDAWRGWAPEKYGTKNTAQKKGLTLFAEKSVLVYLQMISKTYIPREELSLTLHLSLQLSKSIDVAE